MKVVPSRFPMRSWSLTASALPLHPRSAIKLCIKSMIPSVCKDVPTDKRKRGGSCSPSLRSAMHDCSFQWEPKIESHGGESIRLVFGIIGSSAESHLNSSSPKGVLDSACDQPPRGLSTGLILGISTTNPSHCDSILPVGNLRYPRQSASTRWRTGGGAPPFAFFIRVGSNDGPSLRLHQVRDATRGGATHGFLGHNPFHPSTMIPLCILLLHGNARSMW